MNYCVELLLWYKILMFEKIDVMMIVTVMAIMINPIFVCTLVI